MGSLFLCRASHFRLFLSAPFGCPCFLALLCSLLSVRPYPRTSLLRLLARRSQRRKIYASANNPCAAHSPAMLTRYHKALNGLSAPKRVLMDAGQPYTFLLIRSRRLPSTAWQNSA